MKVFVLEGIHFTVPGRARTIFTTRDRAEKEAAALTNDLREWVELPKDATAENWEEKLKEARLQRAEDMGVEIDEDSLDEDPIGEALGDDNGDVWITEEDIVGGGRFVADRSDVEIVAQTNNLARICLIHMGYELPEGHKFYDSDNPRSKQAWQHACEIMEHMTGTDANDALANMYADMEAAEASKMVSVAEVADWIAGQRNDIPATGEEFANAIRHHFR